jgi:hypothetical protein
MTGDLQGSAFEVGLSGFGLVRSLVRAQRSLIGSKYR